MREGLFNWPEQLEPVRKELKPFLRELRGTYGMNVYDIDPYVAVFKLRENMWAMLAPCTHAVDDNWIYLIEGPERALFIDNGFGIGDLKGLGEFLTGKPVITAPTHNHGDHASGCVQWDEVYCHDYCAQILELRQESGWDKKWHSFNHIGEEQCRHYFKDEDIMPFHSFRCVHMQNHDVINLGEDYDIEIIHVGGHAPGNSCYLDKKSRILYSGDALFESRELKDLGVGLNGRAHQGEEIHTECIGISYYSRQIAGLMKRMDEIDYVMPGHGHTDSPKEVINDVYNAVTAVIKDPYCYDSPVESRHGVRYIKTGRHANIRYDIEDVVENLAKYPPKNW